MVRVPFCLLHATTTSLDDIGTRVEWNTVLFGLQSFVHAHLLPISMGPTRMGPPLPHTNMREVSLPKKIIILYYNTIVTISGGV